MPDYPIETNWQNSEDMLSIDWEPEIRISDSSFSAFYSAIAAGENGYVHAITTRGGSGEPYYVRSLDTGMTWQAGYFFWPHGQGVGAYFYKIFTNGDTVSFIFGSDGYAFCLLSSDNGDGWSERYLVEAGGGAIASCQLRDTIYAVHVGIGYISAIFSPDYGRTWRRAILPDNRHPRDIQDLSATSSALHFVGVGLPGQESYYSRLVLGDTAWSYPFNISDDSTHNSFLPRIVAWGDSNVLILWVDYLYSPYPWTGDLFCRRSTDNGQSWQPIVQVTFNHLNLEKYITQRNDTLFVVYNEIVLDGQTNTEEIFFILSPDGGENWEEPVRLTDAPWRSIYPSLDVRDNRIHVAFCDARTDTLYGNSNRLYYKRGILRGPDGIWENSENMPNNMQLGAYPNPFNSSTIITLNDAQGGEADITIYDIMGRQVRTLQLEEGKTTWDATDNAGQQLTSGVYFVRVATPREAKTIKLFFLQ